MRVVLLKKLCQLASKCETRNLIVYLNVRSLSYSPKEYVHNGKDPAPFFFDSGVQTILRSLTRVDLNKVFRKRKTGDLQLEQPTYKFLTDDQLQEVIKEAHKKADKLLQIPPVVKARKPLEKIISNDPALLGLDSSKFVFTDISYGIKNNQRIIAVRELDGTLRHADWETRDRMNQLYFPEEGKKLRTPHMFKDEYLENLMNRKEYESVLDRACIQFDPDDVNFQRITSITYQYVNGNNDFDLLRSTRHFGGLAFFLTWFKNIDNLLLELLETFYIEEVNELLKLYEKLHDVSFKTEKSEELEALMDYIGKEASKKGPLELAVQSYKDIKKQKLEFEKGIKAAHGFT